jgi:hypothetical protein
MQIFRNDLDTCGQVQPSVKPENAATNDSSAAWMFPAWIVGGLAGFESVHTQQPAWIRSTCNKVDSTTYTQTFISAASKTIHSQSCPCGAYGLHHGCS